MEKLTENCKQGLKAMVWQEELKGDNGWLLLAWRVKAASSGWMLFLQLFCFSGLGFCSLILYFSPTYNLFSHY